MNQPPPQRHSWKPLLFAPPQGPDALPKTLPPPAVPPARIARQSSPPPLPAAAKKAQSPKTPAPKTPAPETPVPKTPARGPNESHVRLRPAPLVGNIEFLDAQDLLDELCEDQLNLSMGLACLERAIEDAPRDHSARAALRSLDARLQDLIALRDALAEVHLLTIDPRLQRLFVPEAPLSDYLRGIYAWTHAVVRALDQLAAGLRKLQPDWATLRWRLEEAKNFHFDDLEESIRGDITALAIVASRGVLESARGPKGSAPPAIGDLGSAVGALFAAAHTLEESLDQ